MANGASVYFLCAAIKALEAQHGPRFVAPEEKANEFIQALANAEEAFIGLAKAPPVPQYPAVIEERAEKLNAYIREEVEAGRGQRIDIADLRPFFKFDDADDWEALDL